MVQKIKKNFLLILIISIIINSLCFTQSKKYSDATKDYFLEVALGTDYGDNQQQIKKWVQYIKIYPEYDEIEKQTQTMLAVELKKVVEELNELTNNIQLNIVPGKESANLLVFFGSGEKYAEKFTTDKYYTPPTKESDEEIKKKILSLIESNWGLSWCYWNDKYEITNGSIYVDTKRNTENSALRHTLRKNLTQSLGLMNNSDKYEKSIFYDKWTTVIAFQTIDKEVIEILYRNEIKPGMKIDEVKEVLNNM